MDEQAYLNLLFKAKAFLSGFEGEITEGENSATIKNGCSAVTFRLNIDKTLSVKTSDMVAFVPFGDKKEYWKRLKDKMWHMGFTIKPDPYQETLF